MSIKIEGLDKLYKKLNAAAAAETLRPPMNESVLLLQHDMQEYPPKPAHSRYIRTGTLGRRWTVRVVAAGNGLEGRIGNNVPYGPWVQSQQFQTWFHARTGWPTDDRVVKRNQGRIVGNFQRAIDQALAS